MANIEFSAPEQINNQYDVTSAADIYSMAQVMYWYVFGTINRGTGAKCISQEYKWKNAYIYDQVISKSLRNDPSERFQSIDDIKDFIDNESYEIDSIEDMRKFHRSVLSVVPEFYNHPFVIRDKSMT